MSPRESIIKLLDELVAELMMQRNPIKYQSLVEHVHLMVRLHPYSGPVAAVLANLHQKSGTS